MKVCIKTAFCFGGSRKGHSDSLGLHTMIFQAEIYVIKACVMENIKNGYTVETSMFFLVVKWPSRPLIISR
jgi:hypothetical protein